MLTANFKIIRRWARRLTRGLIQLTRYREYVLFVVVITLFGAKLGGGTPDLKLIGVTLANLLVVAFAFMYNDVVDAPDDALDARKAVRNPISAGLISERTGLIACAIVALLVLSLYALLGGMALLMGTLALALGFLYSWRASRLKAVPIADLISHSLSLAGLQFLAAYFAYGQGQPYGWMFVLVVGLISVYGQLSNELRDLSVDRKAGIRHTAHWLGPRWTKCLMVLSLVAAASVLGAMLWLGTIPLWLLAIPLAAAPFVFGRPAWRLVRGESNLMDDREHMHDPMLVVGLITVTVWFVSERLTL
ncbi:MAG: prenyltransferase [Anaerolineae bacterium]|nr:UbiA family prenyltransferase [Thermoflexales bacterium]MDW8396333.1 prenyltransferase [Anaerolineae bacterium]